MVLGIEDHLQNENRRKIEVCCVSYVISVIHPLLAFEVWDLRCNRNWNIFKTQCNPQRFYRAKFTDSLRSLHWQVLCLGKNSTMSVILVC